MLSLLGSLLGFGTSFLPKVLEFFQDKRDKAHELAMIAAQTDAQVRLEGVRLEAMNVEADIRETEALLHHDTALNKRASQWVVNFSALIRPSVAFLLFGELFILTFLLATDSIDQPLYQTIWNEPMQAVFSTVIAFYFGSRSFNRKNHS